MQFIALPAIKQKEEWQGYNGCIWLEHYEKMKFTGGAIMAKAGMRRPDPKQSHGTESNKKQHLPKNSTAPVPEIQGKAKSGKAKAEE